MSDRPAPPPGLDRIEGWAREVFQTKNDARERALARSRELIRTCATSIRAIHRDEFDNSADLLMKARAINDELAADLAPHPDLYYTGYVQDAQKELIEAYCVAALVRDEPLPQPEALGIAPAAFLNGLAEAVGELRRYSLDRLRRGDTSRSEALLRAMDEIYNVLVTLDFPDALTGGLRRTTDATRAILERTRGDLTFALRQDRLEARLARFEEKIKES